MRNYFNIGISRVIETKQSESYRYVKAIFVETSETLPMFGNPKQIKKEFELEVVSTYEKPLHMANVKTWSDFISIKDGANIFGTTNIALHSLFELNLTEK